MSNWLANPVGIVWLSTRLMVYAAVVLPLFVSTQLRIGKARIVERLVLQARIFEARIFEPGFSSRGAVGLCSPRRGSRPSRSPAAGCRVIVFEPRVLNRRVLEPWIFQPRHREDGVRNARVVRLRILNERILEPWVLEPGFSSRGASGSGSALQHDRASSPPATTTPFGAVISTMFTLMRARSFDEERRRIARRTRTAARSGRAL